MQDKTEHSAILLTFVKLPLVNKTFVLSIFEWPFWTGFTVAGCGLAISAAGEGKSSSIYWVKK